MFDWVRSDAAALSDALSAWRREFHRYAEPGWLEMRTTSRIAGELARLGYEVFTGRDVCFADARMGLPDEKTLEAHYLWAAENGADPRFLPASKGGFTGAMGVLRCGAGPTLALRFDIDALGVQESCDPAHRPTAEGFASLNPGVMHACGHDGHAAIGLGVARLLMQYRAKLHGTVLLLFQPAEEGVRGARSMVARGLLDQADYVLAGHIFPNKMGDGAEIGIIRQGSRATLATSKYDVAFHGQAAHAGISPQLGRNALLCAATAVLNLHAIPRYGDVPTQVNVGRLTAGTGRNVVCELAKLELEVRGQTDEANRYMEERALAIVNAAAQMYGCTAQVVPAGGAPSLGCTWALSERLQAVSRKLGFTTALIDGIGGGSEDFACMAERVQAHGGQAAFFALLTECPAANHNDRFDFDEEVLSRGTAVFCATALELLGG